MNYINNKNKIYKVVFSLIGFILMLSGVSYAYFVSKVNNNESASTIVGEAANLELEFKEGSNQINGEDIFPGWSDTKTFTVKNKSSIDVYYNLYISDIKNELMSESISYKIESTDGGYNLEKVLLPSTDGIIKTGIYIKGNTSHTYKITTYYNNLDIDQRSEKGKTFSFKIYIKANVNDRLIVDLNGGTSEQDFSKNYKEDEVVELKEPTRNGYTFAGWEFISGDGVILNNLIKNGSFEDGTKGWNNRTLTLSSVQKKYGNNSIRNYQLGSHVGCDQNLNTIGNHTYYYSVWLFEAIKSSGTCYIEANFIYDNVNHYKGIYQGVQTNTWTKKSKLINDISSNAITNFSICTSNVTDKTQDCYCDGALFLDLTESFGAGNEPTQEWCDKNLDYFDEYALKIGSKATTVKAKWKKTVTLTNLIKNGSFEDGTKGWNNRNLTLSSVQKKYGNNSIRNYQLTQWSGVGETIKIKKGHKYYTSTWQYNVRENSSNYCYNELNYNYNGKKKQYGYTIALENLNSWTKAGRYVDNVLSDSDAKMSVCINSGTDKSQDCYCDGVLLVDLTEHFGEGNEPDKEWCDANIDWFDGTVSKEFIF